MLVKILANIQPNYDIDLESGARYEASNLINIELKEDTKIDFEVKTE